MSTIRGIKYGKTNKSSFGTNSNQFLVLNELSLTLSSALVFIIQSLTTEAKLCIKDCDESTETDFEEEFVSAKMAVGEKSNVDVFHLITYRISLMHEWCFLSTTIDSASIAYSELLEELALTDEGIPLLNEIRKMYAPSVEDLRTELKALMKMKAM